MGNVSTTAGGFRFHQPDEVEALAPVGELSDDTEDGHIYEVDLYYPQHLHNAHDDYALYPESLEIGSDMYSPSLQPFHRLHLQGNSLLI